MLKGRGALQDIDQMSLFKSLCKYTATIKRIKDIPYTMRQAIKIAQSGTPGPVFIEFPIDTLYPYHIIQKELGAKNQEAKNVVQKVINLYLNNYLCSLFAGAFEKHDYSPLKPDIKFAETKDGKFIMSHLCRTLCYISRKKISFSDTYDLKFQNSQNS